MKRILFLSLLLLSGLSLVTGCSDDDPVTPDPAAEKITVTGSVYVKEGLTDIPENLSLRVVWGVDAAGDYMYVYGNGNVDLAAGTFSLTMERPPAPALNSDPSGVRPSFGVGFSFFGDFHGDEGHKLQEGELESPIFGAVSNTGIIFVDGDPGEYASHAELSWISEFASGFGMGEGQGTSGMHDKFVPTTMSSFQLTITNDPSDIEFPNWK